MSAAESAMFSKLARRSSGARTTHWTRAVDSGGWPRLESGDMTIAKVMVDGQARYELWRGHTKGGQPKYVREVSAAEVILAQHGGWTP